MATHEASDDCRAPEVVRPRKRDPISPDKSPSPKGAQSKANPTPGGAASAGVGHPPSPPPPVPPSARRETIRHPKTTSAPGGTASAGVGRSPLPPPPVPPSARRETVGTRQKSPPETPRPSPDPKAATRQGDASPTQKKSSAGGWIVFLVVGGIILFGWITANMDRYEPVEQPVHRTIAPSSAPIAPPPPFASQSKAPLREDAPPPSSIQPLRQEPPRIPIRHTGDMALTAIAVAADGKRYSVTGPAAITLTERTSGTKAFTNATLPCKWGDLSRGTYIVSASVDGYRHHSQNPVAIAPLATAEMVLHLEPLPAQVRFTVSPTNAVPSIFKEGRLLGQAPGPITLPPFVKHVLTFKAPGWRERTQTVTIPKPRKTYQSKIAMERIEAGLTVEVVTSERNPPAKGSIRINSSKPVAVDLPFQTQRIPFEGEVTVFLDVDGYSGISSQKVVLVDRQMAEVQFAIEKPSWTKRTLRSISGAFRGEGDK
jgi:hypothetical protein